jgi:hypothetical protein
MQENNKVKKKRTKFREFNKSHHKTTSEMHNSTDSKKTVSKATKICSQHHSHQET